MSSTFSGLFSSPTHSQVQYRLTDLGALTDVVVGTDQPKSSAFAINNRGIIVGKSDQLVTIMVEDDLKERAFVWIPYATESDPVLGFCAPGLYDLGVLPGTSEDSQSEAKDISESGFIVGISNDLTGAAAGIAGLDFDKEAFLWQPSSVPCEDGMMVALGSLAEPVTGGAQAYGVNDEVDENNDLLPRVVGVSDTNELCGSGEPTCHTAAPETNCRDLAFSWQDGMMTELFSSTQQFDTVSSQANAVRSRFTDPTIAVGKIFHCKSGIQCANNSDPAAWEFFTNNVNELRVLDEPDNEANGEAFDVDIFERIVGETTYDEGRPFCVRKAVYWDDIDAQVLNLGEVWDNTPGVGADPPSTARAINNLTNPQVVGYGHPSGTTSDVAILWECDSTQGPCTDQNNWTATNLDETIWDDCDFDLRQAHDINDRGWIVGVGRNQLLNRTRAYVLRPVDDCPGDIAPEPVGNGVVDVDDLAEVVINWGSCLDCCGSCCACRGDTDGDCDVDVDDLGTVHINWNNVCSAQGAQGGGAVNSLTIEELIDLLLQIAAENPGVEDNVADAIAALLEE